MGVSINREFDGGYCRTDAVLAVIQARRERLVGKAELRLFFAGLEHRETRETVPIDIIINRRRATTKRMTLGQQERARVRLQQALEACQGDGGGFGAKLPRKFVRAAARGLLDVSEMVTALCYFLRRMPQRSRRKCLVRGERYGRLSVRTVRSMSGLCLDVIVKAIRKLREIGLLALVWRPMVEIKRWGRLFVDGRRVSVSFHKPEHSRSSAPSVRLQETRTVPPEKSNEKNETIPKNSLNRLSLKGVDVITAFAAKFCPDHPLLRG